MKWMTVYLILLAASATALQMTNDERNALLKELAAWKASAAGLRAAAHHLLPPSPLLQSLSSDQQLDVELARFAATKKIVAALNAAHPHATFSTDNRFALLTSEEFRTYAQGALPKQILTRQLRDELTSAQLAATSVDWTTTQCMPAVRDQGQCGSCWAISATGAAEMAHCLATGKLLNLAEQQLVSCANNAGYGCNGGWPSQALDYIATTGLCSSSEFPYTASDASCNTTCSKTKLQIGATVNIQGERALQAAIDMQPVVVTVEAGNDVWRNYKSGVVTQCPGAASDHAVVAVGYGSSNGTAYYKIRNSWGEYWGDHGYIYLQRGVGGKGMCNVADQCSYPTMVAGKPTTTPTTTTTPTVAPTYTPTHTATPTIHPTTAPSNPVVAPTTAPTDTPRDKPTAPPAPTPRLTTMHPPAKHPHTKRGHSHTSHPSTY
ncbi:hypothetical protein SPRG_13888 [Saprolegnia parasitica CBS 223.65]|uniref:Peptidase C1A papain C-terminal domain-containing protein n=1 Tax=Saprolegnia parasitica (strain CBS 223.65) TaxID=695850 RepID=A0A067BR44_SAPPC|nr:hypothetical protein SPRG_13888 [Saprolegnia parasitica CBS 223.65]KDO20994.1 hypothetical protein SPRG_13888 [Saprolegnia parasitica CBS 223.65]|eukprot:XP_012208306.1 hypothetical protein SPRG_13888 [Saprolegnia parasitica CBS 223.65]